MRSGSASFFGISLIIPPFGSLTVDLFRKHNLLSLRGNRICHSRRLYRNQQEDHLFLVFCLVPYFSLLAGILLWLVDLRSLLFHHYLIFFCLSLRKKSCYLRRVERLYGNYKGSYRNVRTHLRFPCQWRQKSCLQFLIG